VITKALSGCYFVQRMLQNRTNSVIVLYQDSSATKR